MPTEREEKTYTRDKYDMMTNEIQQQCSTKKNRIIDYNYCDNNSNKNNYI